MRFLKRSASIVVAALALASSAMAQTTPTIDLSAVTTGIGDVKDAVIGVAPTVIAAAFAVFAIKWGVGFVIGLFKKASNKG